jgi:SSS family solute:Na+ symporter
VFYLAGCYWGTNQYIFQRALAAKSINEAQTGVAFAAFLKILMPLIVVIPGIAAFYLQADISKADEAFHWWLNNYVSTGLKDLVFAALIAAIGSSISSIVNSTSTIFTLDIYKQFNENLSERNLVRIGKISATAALLIGALVAPSLQTLGQFLFLAFFGSQPQPMRLPL